MTAHDNVNSEVIGPPIDVAQAPPGLSRRSILARGAVVGGAAWAAPAIVTARADAATGSTVCVGGITITTAGEIHRIPAPVSTGKGQTTSEEIQYWNERDGFPLPRDVPVDQTPQGGSGVVPEGTPVAIWFFHFDPADLPKGIRAHVRASATFSGRILGVIWSDALLNASDDLGHPGTDYPDDFARSGLDNQSDIPTVDSFTLTFNNKVSHDYTDQVRVIVTC